jgi:hypothetical protein
LQTIKFFYCLYDNIWILLNHSRLFPSIESHNRQLQVHLIYWLKCIFMSNLAQFTKYNLNFCVH